jgi:hypothetical protein
MSQYDEDPWRTPSLDELGRRFAELEARPPKRVSRPRWLAAWSSAAATLGVAVAAVLFATTRSADASSPVNRAPAAAVKAGTVAYNSTTTVTVDGHPTTTLIGRGSINFRAGSYRAIVQNTREVESVERIRVGTTLYTGVAASAAGPSGWVAIPLGHQGILSDPDVPGSGALTDPPAVLRAMSLTRAHARADGEATINGTKASGFSTTVPLSAFFADTAVPAAVGRSRVGLTVWVGPKDRPMRIREQVKSLTGSAVLMTIWTFDHFGVPVQITAPTDRIARAGAGSAGPDPLARDLISRFLAHATEPHN